MTHSVYIDFSVDTELLLRAIQPKPPACLSVAALEAHAALEDISNDAIDQLKRQVFDVAATSLVNIEGARSILDRCRKQTIVRVTLQETR